MAKATIHLHSPFLVDVNGPSLAASWGQDTGNSPVDTLTSKLYSVLSTLYKLYTVYSAQYIQYTVNIVDCIQHRL